jgi:hypothetical protein
MVILFLAVSPILGHAATGADSTLVEVNYPIDVQTTYKERRRSSGANFGVHMEQFVPSQWASLIDGSSYDETYGSTPVNIFSLEGGYKLNFALGSISLLGGFGSGQASAQVDGGNRSMTVSKFYAKGMYILDNILPEPYIAPYVAGSVWKMQIKESEDISDAGGNYSTGIGFDYTLGVLFQLNWLEQELSTKTLNDDGIQNTFLDIFATQYLKTQNPDDPSLASNFILGVGLRLEF